MNPTTAPEIGCATAGEYRARLRHLLDKLDCDAIDAVGDVLFGAWRQDRQVFVFGNGGSAATASHWVTDLVQTAAVGGARRLRAMSLVDNLAMTTAIANDLAYDRIFEEPLGAWARERDVAIAISGSGTSPNVVRACRLAADRGLDLIALTGFTGGAIGPMARIHVHVPSENYGLIEDLHLAIGHIVSQRLRRCVEADQVGG